MYRSVCRLAKTRRIVVPVRLSLSHITGSLIKQLHVTLPSRLHMVGSEAGEKRYPKSTCSWELSSNTEACFSLTIIICCCYAVSRSLIPIMRNVTYFLRIWYVGAQKEDRVCIGHGDKVSVKGYNGT